MSGTYKGRRFADTLVAVYHRRGNLLSGVYVQGGAVAAEERVAIRAVIASAANLERG